MKHTLLIAGIFTVFFAVFLVWADNLLANHLESREQRIEFVGEPLGFDLRGDTLSLILPKTDHAADPRSVQPPRAEPVCLP